MQSAAALCILWNTQQEILSTHQQQIGIYLKNVNVSTCMSSRLAVKLPESLIVGEVIKDFVNQSLAANEFSQIKKKEASPAYLVVTSMRLARFHKSPFNCVST